MRINNVSKIVVLILTLMMLLSSTVFAVPINITHDNAVIFDAVFKEVEKSVETDPSTHDSSIQVASKDSASTTGKETIMKWDISANKFEFYQDAFKKSNQKQAKNALKAFINELKDSSLTLDTQQDIMTQIQESDSDVAAIMIPMIFDESKADLFTAYKWLYPLLSILRVVFGIGSILIILLLFGSTIMDLVYIGLPVWRESQSEKSGSKNPFGVSYEAMKTVKEVEKNLGEGSYQNAYVLYFKRRALTYVMLAICLLYLIVGEIGGLVTWVLNLAGGIVG